MGSNFFRKDMGTDFDNKRDNGKRPERMDKPVEAGTFGKVPTFKSGGNFKEKSPGYPPMGGGKFKDKP